MAATGSATAPPIQRRDDRAALCGPPRGGEAGKSGWVWKFNSSYNLSDDLMAYATYSKGYRIGGPNSVAPCPNPLPNDPDGIDEGVLNVGNGFG